MTFFSGQIKATGVSTFRNNLKKNLDEVFKEKLTLIVTRNNDENVVVVSEDYFNDLQKELNNLKYIAKLKQADQEISENKVYKYTPSINKEEF